MRIEADNQVDAPNFATYSADITAIVDREAFLRYISPSVQTILGYSPEELVNLNALDFIHPDDLERAHARLEQLLAQPTQPLTSELRFRHKNNHWVPLELIAHTRTTATGQLQLHVSGRDISTRWYTRKACRQSEKQFRMIFDNSPDAMFVESLNGIVLEVNNAACTLHGLPRDKIIGQSVLELVPPSERDAVFRDFPQIVSGKITKVECQSFNVQGQAIPVETTISRIQFSDEPALLLNVRDISDRKHAEAIRRKLEDNIHQTQKLDAIGRLSASIAHDFNNLLTIIQGYAELLLSNPALDQTVRIAVEQIGTATISTGNLTRQLLTFSRKYPLRAAPVDLNQVLVRFEKTLTKALGPDITLQRQLAPSPAWISGDTDMIEQMLLNLATNAHDVIRKNGRVTIRIESVAHNTANISATPQTAVADRYVCIIFSDNGEGIPAENLPRLFEPIFTTKESAQNTGLGLAISYGIIKQHHGWIDVESRLDQGTTFRIFFPSIPTPGQTTQQSSPTQATILVLENNPEIRHATTSTLRDEGYRVLEADNVLAALQLIDRSNKTDIIIANPVLCNSSNGHDILAELKACNPQLKVIFTKDSTNKNHHNYESFIPTGDVYLPTPLNTATLRSVVHKTMEDS